MVSGASERQTTIGREIGKALENAIDYLKSKITDPTDERKLTELDAYTKELVLMMQRKEAQVKEMIAFIQNTSIYKTSDVLKRKNFLIKKYQEEIQIGITEFRKIKIEIEQITSKYPDFTPNVMKFIEQINKKEKLLESIKNYKTSGKWVERKYTVSDGIEECSICLTKFIEGDNLYVHNDKHKTHVSCFKDGKMTFCPVDRAPFNKMVLRKEFGKRRISKKKRRVSSKRRRSRKIK